MVTERQKRIVAKVSENIGKTKPVALGKLLQESGYSESISKTPKMVMKSKGVKQLLIEAGITGEVLSKQWNNLIEMPIKESSMLADTKRRVLKDLTELMFTEAARKMPAQFQFIDKFLNLQVLKQNKPRIHPGKYTKEAAA